MKFAAWCMGLAIAWQTAAMAALPPEMFAVPLPVSAPRLLGMSMDDDGFIWLGSTHRAILRYDPRTGAIEEIRLPFDSSTSQTMCVGKKVYLLGQTYPKLMCYDREAKTFSEHAYPVAKPDVWYGAQAGDERYLYLFDRSGEGVVKWDTSTDVGTVIAYPYETPIPTMGRYVVEDGAIWCGVWDLAGGQYVPLGIARLDVAKDRFTDFYDFPAADAKNPSATDPETTLYYPRTLQGELVPFDWKARQWRRAIPTPEFGERFAFIGLGTPHEGLWYFSLSTYNGTEIGCDGQPYHFCNSVMAFDPQTNEFAFPTFTAPGAYYQVSYQLSAGGQFFATGNDIRQADGRLNNAQLGKAIFWQTQRIAGE